jgi:serine/threonine protein kinase
MTTLADNRSFGPYEIISPLGSGGMGEVYRARDTRLKRDVALKLLSAEVPEDSDRYRRFFQEARAASSLNHPNILSVFDVGTENGTQYIVSELIEGESLRSLIGKGPLSLKRYLDIAIQIGAGLTAAHEAGIIHRDLKPENIMITRDNRVKILDFGLAKPVGSEKDSADEHRSQLLTQPGVILGTVSYMSPEQARGEGIDFRSDQFSLGLILYEMATGKKAFHRDTPVQTLSAILSEEPPSVSSLNPKFPAPLRWLIDRCLAKDLRERYGATIDIFHELRAFRDHISETSYSGESLVAGKSTRKISKTLLYAGIAVTSLIVGFLLGWIGRDSTQEPNPAYQFTPVASNRENENFPAWSPDGKTIAYVGEVNGILQVFTRSLAVSIPEQITFNDGDCFMPVWAPDGTRIYYTQRRKGLNRFDIWSVGAAGGTPTMVAENSGWPTISPDGNSMAFFRAEEKDLISLWSANPIGSKPVKYSETPFDKKKIIGADAVFSPDGKKLAVQLWSIDSGKVWELWILPFPKGEPRQLKKLSGVMGFFGFSWTPDSKHLVVSTDYPNKRKHHLALIDLDRETITPITFGVSEETSPAVSSDGKRIAFSSGNAQYDLIDVPLDGRPMEYLTSTPLNERAPAWSPQGNQFAYVSDRNGADVIWLRSQTEGWERPLVTEKDFPNKEVIWFSRPCFSPDGSRVAYHVHTTATTQIWISSLAGGSPIRLFNETLGQFSPSWSSDGNWIAYLRKMGWQHELVKMRVGGTDSPVIIEKSASYFQPQWSPDGTSILFQTAEGEILASVDGTNRKIISKDIWFTGGWSRDGSLLYAVRQDANRKMIVISFDPKTGKETSISDLGPIPLQISDSPFAGFSMAPDGKSFATSILRTESDLWILEDFKLTHR